MCIPGSARNNFNKAVVRSDFWIQVFKSVYVQDESLARVWKAETHIILFIMTLLFYVHGKHLRSCRDGQLT